MPVGGPKLKTVEVLNLGKYQVLWNETSQVSKNCNKVCRPSLLLVSCDDFFLTLRISDVQMLALIMFDRNK